MLGYFLNVKCVNDYVPHENSVKLLKLTYRTTLCKDLDITFFYYLRMKFFHISHKVKTFPIEMISVNFIFQQI